MKTMKSLENEILQIILDNIEDIESAEMEIADLYHDYEEKITNYISEIFIKHGNNGVVTYSDISKYNRLHTFQKYLEEQAVKVAEKESSIVTTLLLLVFGQVYYRQAFVLGKLTKTNVKYKKWENKDIETIVHENWNGTVYTERIKTNQLTLVNKIITSFTQSIRRQQPLDIVAKEINKLMNIRYSQSKSLVETESFRVIADSQLHSFEYSKIVESLYFHATLDEKTTVYCREHHGNIYAMEDPYKPMLPAHIHCRSIWLPILMEVSSSDNYRDFNTFEEWYEFNI